MLRFAGVSTEEFEIVNHGSRKRKVTKNSKTAKKRKSSTTIETKHTRKNEVAVVTPAWNDDSDADTENAICPPRMLDVKFIRKSAPAVESDDSDNEHIISATSNILRKSDSVELINSKSINIRRLFDANRERISMGSISSVHFNPAYRIFLTASLDSTLALFKADGAENEFLRDRVFEKYPLSSAKFTSTGTNIVLTGNKCSFRLYSLETGKETRASRFIGSAADEVLDKCELSPNHPDLVALGNNIKSVYLTDLRSLEKVAVFRTTSPLKSFDFLNAGPYFNTFDASGCVQTFDLRNTGKPRIIHRWFDQACTGGTGFCVSPDSRWTACGSDSGYVNIYSAKVGLSQSHPQPDRTVANLISPVDSMQFHPTSQMLCLASSHREAAIRLYHLDARLVFNNFPVLLGRLHRPTCVAFSPSGGYLCVGQQNGRAALYNIPHYADY